MRPYAQPFLLVHQTEHVSQLPLAHSLVTRLSHDQLMQQGSGFADLIPLHHHILVPTILLSSQIQLLPVDSSWHAATELASMIGPMLVSGCGGNRARPEPCPEGLPTAPRIGL